MATDMELLVDAFVSVGIALDHPDLSPNERAILEMECIRRWPAEDVAATLCMTMKEYRRTKGEALEKAKTPPPMKAKRKDEGDDK